MKICLRFLLMLNALLPLSAEEHTTPAAPGPVMTATDLGALFDGIMPLQLGSNDIAGAVVVVVKDGQVLFAKGYGYANVEARKPVSPDDTLFRVGSVSKLFTWTAVMQLVEQGRIDLDADVNRYLDFKIPEAFGQPVTVRHLMTHTAGFEDSLQGLFGSDPKQTADLRALLLAHPPARIYAPGTTPAYSNYGALLAGYIVQRVSGEDYATYVQRHILAPLGMAHATASQPLPASLAPLMSTGYARASGEGHLRRPPLRRSRAGLPSGPCQSRRAPGHGLADAVDPNQLNLFPVEAGLAQTN